MSERIAPTPAQRAIVEQLLDPSWVTSRLTPRERDAIAAMLGALAAPAPAWDENRCPIDGGDTSDGACSICRITQAALLNECHHCDERAATELCRWCGRRGTGTQPAPAGDGPRLVTAAQNADWMQVVLNQGPPCFHLEGERFCLRAQRWQGHGEDRTYDHAYVSLAVLLSRVLVKETP